MVTEVPVVYGIHDVVREMEAVGSFYWSPATRRAFGVRLVDHVRRIEGVGVVFVSSTRGDVAWPRRYKVVVWTGGKGTWDLAECGSRDAAIRFMNRDACVEAASAYEWQHN